MTSNYLIIGDPLVNAGVPSVLVEGAAPVAGQAIVAIDSQNATWQNVSGSGTPTGPAGGDLSGTYPNPTVVSLTGTAGLITISGTTLSFNSGVNNPVIKQADLTTASGTGNSLTLQAQNETGTTSIGGDLYISSGSGTSADGRIHFQTASSDLMLLNSNKLYMDVGNNFATKIVSTTYQVLQTDRIILANTSSGAFTVTLPTAVNSLEGDDYIIMDAMGTAATHNITISANVNIDGGSGFTIDQNYKSVRVVFNGTTWNTVRPELPITSSVTMGGDVTGNSSSCTVIKVDGVSYPATPSTNTVPVVTGSNTVTYQQIVDAQISSSAAIAVNKLASGTADQLLDTNHTGTTTEWFTLGGDATFASHNLTVTALQGNAVKSGTLGATQDGYALIWTNSASQWQARSIPTILADGQDYQFSNTSSDISGYQQLLDVSNGSQADLSQAVTSGGGKTLIKAFASTATSPGVAVIPAGLWEFNYYGYASITGAFTTQLVFDVYTRTSGGTETLLFSVTGPNLNVTSVGQFTVSYNMTSDTYINNTTRIVIKVSAQTSNAVTVTAHFVFDGTTNISLVRTPIAGDAIQLGGDLSGTTNSATVIGIQGNTFTSGSPTKGQFVMATSTSNYGPITLSGDISESSSTAGLLTVIALQGNAVLSQSLGAGQDQYVLTWNNGTSNWQAKAASGGGITALTGDVAASGTGSVAATVAAISGSTPIVITPAELQWKNSTSSPLLDQAALSSTSSGNGSNGQTLSVTAQAGQAATGASHAGGVGGALHLNGGAGGTSGSSTNGVGGNVVITPGAGASGAYPGSILLAGSQNVVVSSLKTANYTVQLGDFLVGVGTLSGHITINLPANTSPTTPSVGDKYIIKDVNGTVSTTNYVTVGCPFASIDGISTSINLTSPYFSATFVFTGNNNWSLI